MTPAMHRAKKMIEQLYNRHSAGCCLHIVTDDGNIADGHVSFCVKYARKENHPSCESLAKLIEGMTLLERAHLLNMRWCSKHEFTHNRVCGVDNCNEKTEPLKPLEELH